MFKRLIIIVATLFLLAPLWGNGALFAQQYPVQGSFTITPPYAVNLSDYANINLQNLALNITLTDMVVTNKRVRLKLFIQNQSSLIAQSADNIQGEAVIHLDGGMPVRLSNSELATYFRLNNLQGISPDTYANALPEGVYTFGFEVYDYFTGSRLSNRISQTFWLIINNPPLLNTPADKSKQADFTTSGGGIVFNWTPRSTQVSNTDYEFTLCELWDPSGDPYQQFMSAIPKYQTTLSNATTLVYGLSQPPLNSGYTYAWRVRAKAKAGFEDVGLYRNNGYSDLFTFRYGNPCPAPQNLKTDVKSAEQINLTWEAPANSSGGESYLVSYRKYSIDGRWSWTTTSTSNLFFNVTNLEASTEYEFKTGRECSSSALIAGQAEAAYTDTRRATTLAPEQIAGVECGKEPVINISNQTLLPLLKANDVVMAGDFPVTITRVEGSQQGWSGEGWVKVPWLGDTRIRVKYASIRVNSDYKLIAGSFDTTYDPTGKNIGDVDKAIEDAKGLVTGGTDVGKPITGTDATTYTLPYTLTDNDITTSTFKPAVTTGETGSTTPAAGGTITFGNGQTLAVNDVPTTVKDGSGNIYQVSDKGKVTKIGNSGGGSLLASANLTVIDGSKGTVSFSAADDTKYAFDAWQKTYDANSTWKAKYETITLAGGGSYRVSSKLMLPGEADKVIATVALSDKSLSPDSIRFSNASGTLFEKTKLDNNRFELSLVGGPAGDAQEIYALYPLNGKTYTLGKLLVASYQPRTVRLSLVPVNGTTVNEDAVRSQLEELYNPLGVDFDVSVEDNFDYTPLQNTPLQVEGSGLLSVYTEQMKALNNAFVASGNYEKGTVYLFVLPKGADKNGNEKGLEGAMPRAQQFGYLFAEGLNDKELALAAAHEVGHGVFQLQHTFSYSGFKQGALSSNLMDYPAGSVLAKPQWDLIHDPGLVIGVFETDKGVEFAGGAVLSPDLQLISIPNSHALFSSNIYQQYFLTGTLPGFTVNKSDDKYVYYAWNGSKYINVLDPSDIYTPSSVAKPGGSIFLFYNLEKGCGSKSFITTSYTTELQEILALSDKQEAKTKLLKLVTNLASTSHVIPCNDGTTTKTTSWTESKPASIDCNANDIATTLAPYLNNINTITPTTGAAETNKILLNNYQPCVFANIKVDQRIVILNNLLNDGVDDSQWEFSKGILSLGDTFYLDDLILSTPESDRKKLLQDGFMKNGWLTVLFNKGKGSWLTNNDATMAEITPLFKGIASWVSTYYSALNISITKQDVINIGTSEFDHYDYPVASVNPVYLGSVSDDQFDFVEIRNGTQYKSKINRKAILDFENDRINFNYELAKKYQGSVFSAQGNTPTDIIEEYNLRVNPYEPVIMIAARNYLDLGIEKGTEYIVPAFLAAAYEQCILDNISNENIRSVGNSIAIASAIIAIPETGGGSLSTYLTIATGVVSSIDIALKNDRLKLNSDADFKAKYQSYYDAWDIFYNAVSLADNGAGIYNLAKGLSKVNLAIATKSFYTKMKDFDFNGELMGVWNKLKGVTPTITNPKNIREAARDWVTVKQDRFNLADDFYKKVGAKDYDNELRGIDFDKPVQKTPIKKDEYLYQYCKTDDKGKPIIGQYFYRNEKINPNKLGFDIKNRILVKVKVSETTEFLESTAATIDDWNGSTKVFEGGEIQLFNKQAKVIVISF